MNSESELNRLLGKVWRNPYDVLDLPETSTDDQIKKKFKKMALVLHPDRCSDPRAEDAFISTSRYPLTLFSC